MLEAGHYILLAVILCIIGAGFYKAAQKDVFKGSGSNPFKGYVIGMTLWIAYVSVMAGSGFLADFSLPPKFVLFIILPAFVIIGWFFTAKRNKTIITSFPIALTVYYQTFRIVVEILIWGMTKEGMAPELVSFEGRNFDILAGLSAPVIGYLAYQKKVLSHKSVIVWNFIGLLLLANIVSIFLTLVVKPDMWGYAEVPVSLEFPTLPYVFIAGAFMPTAVFMHIFSIKKSLQAINEAKI